MCDVSGVTSAGQSNAAEWAFETLETVSTVVPSLALNGGSVHTISARNTDTNMPDTHIQVQI